MAIWLLLSPKADTHFTIPRRVEGWVYLGTAVKVHNPCSRLYTAVAVVINKTATWGDIQQRVHQSGAAKHWRTEKRLLDAWHVSDIFTLSTPPSFGTTPLNCQSTYMHRWSYWTFTCCKTVEFGNFAWNLVIWLSGKSLNFLPPDVGF